MYRERPEQVKPWRQEADPWSSAGEKGVGGAGMRTQFLGAMINTLYNYIVVMVAQFCEKSHRHGTVHVWWVSFILITSP